MQNTILSFLTAVTLLSSATSFACGCNDLGAQYACADGANVYTCSDGGQLSCHDDCGYAGYTYWPQALAKNTAVDAQKCAPDISREEVNTTL